MRLLLVLNVLGPVFGVCALVFWVSAGVWDGPAVVWAVVTAVLTTAWITQTWLSWNDRTFVYRFGPRWWRVAWAAWACVLALAMAASVWVENPHEVHVLVLGVAVIIVTAQDAAKAILGLRTTDGLKVPDDGYVD